MELKKKVNDILRELCFEPRLSGYGYLRDAIIICCENKSSITNLLKSVYTCIAEKNNTNVKAVDRNIRHAISTCIINADPKLLAKYINIKMKDNIYVPTNSEFIAAICDYIDVYLS